MSDSRLFTPLTIGNIKMEHRMAMAPLTRFRALNDHAPSDIMTEYYEQRSRVPGSLLITEGTFISREDGGFANVPGIWNQQQVNGWRKVTDAVHKNGSYIFCQLWALGRAAQAKVAKEEGFDVVSSDAIPINAKTAQPRRLTLDEIPQRIQNYVTAAKKAIEAGFDGVEIHGANGYLVDQFTQDRCNQRDDQYGGSVENRSRFAVEVAKAVSKAIGPEKTGIRLSPFSTFQSMKMDDPVTQFSDVIRKLNSLDLAYLHLVESRIAGAADVEGSESLTFAYSLWNGPLIIAGGYNADSAKLMADKYPEKQIVIAFGRYYISTPDLPFRVQKGIPCNPYHRETFYNPGNPAGYVDYPFSSEFMKGTSFKPVL